MTIQVCTHCRRYGVLTDGLCERCAWMAQIGAIVEFATGGAHRWSARYLSVLWDVLDAVAFLLIHRAQTAAYWRKTMREEQRDAQRSVSEAYSKGRYDSAVESMGWLWRR